MFSINVVTDPNVLTQTGLSQAQLNNVITGLQQAVEVWGRYIDGSGAIIDVELTFEDLPGNALAEAGANFYSLGRGQFFSEVIEELNGRQENDNIGNQLSYGTIDANVTVDLPRLLNGEFYFSDNLDFQQNPGLPGQTDFLTLAIHELGHALGFNNLDFDGFVQNNQFTGENARAANGGNNVQLADGVHIASGPSNFQTGDDILSPTIFDNVREFINPVTIGILQDVDVPIVTASADEDTLYGFHRNNDIVSGLDGNDSLHGLSGNDTLNGNNGNDYLEGGLGADILFGGDDDDILAGEEGADQLDGGTGNDTASFVSSSAGVTVSLEAGISGIGGDAQGDTFFNIENLAGSNFNDTLQGNTLDNRILAGEGNDIISGGSGNDTLEDAGGNDEIFGGEGDDTFIAGTGANEYDGGSGVDTVDFSAFAGAINVDLRTQTTFSGGAASNDTITGIERLVGTAGNDRLVGNAEGDSDTATGDNFLDGGAGNDRIFGGGNNDTLLGGADDDELFGNSGNDMLFGGDGNDVLDDSSGNDEAFGGGGDDTFVAGAGANEYDGGSGVDTVDFSAFVGAINVDLRTQTTFSGGAASNDTITGIEGLVGTAGNDRLVGNAAGDANTATGDNFLDGGAGNDRIFGGGGNDTILDGSGNDELFGNSGNDTFIAGTGANEYDGGSGSDTVDFSAFNGAITVNLTSNTTSGGAAGNDTITSIENLVGTNGGDTLVGNGSANTLSGGNGNDRFFGGSGADTLFGGDGEDFFDGGGGSGTDQLFGGADADIFHFDSGEGADVVNDFENNIDTIQFDNFAGTTTTSAFIADFATQTGGDVVFDFGADGSLTVLDTTLGQLQNDVEIV